MPHELKRCAIYTRRSVADPDPVLSSSLIQERECLALLWRRSWAPVQERFDDDGWSGTNGERPALLRLLDRIEAGEIDHVVVYRLDRLTRSLRDWVMLWQVFQRFGVGLSVAANDLDAGGALSNMQLNILAMFAELELETLRERLLDGHAARRAQGLRTSGALPFGYRRDERKQLVLVDRQAAVVRRMFELARAGALPAEIARDPRVQHRSRRWTARSVLRLLSNPTYAARLLNGSPAQHRGIVDAELFDAVGRTIRERRTREPSTRPALGLEDPFVLRGLLVCSRCGARMTTSTTTKVQRVSRIDGRCDADQLRYYRCRRGCRGAQLAAARAEEALEQLVMTPPLDLPAHVRDDLRQLARMWDRLFPRWRRVALEKAFESLRWSPGRRRLIPALKADAISGATESAVPATDRTASPPHDCP